MRIIAIIGMVLTLGAALPTAATAQDPDRARRLSLAEEYVRLSAGEEVEKLVDQMIESQLAASPDMGEAERAWMRRNMPTLTLDFIDDLSGDLAVVYADVFTTAELEALVAFFSTPMGRSIATKQFEVGTRSGEIMSASLIRFLQNMEAKFCAEFECDGPSMGVSSTK